MRRILFTFSAIVLMFSLASAGNTEGCGDKTAAKATGAKSCCSAKQANAGCAVKAATVSQEKTTEGDHACPDVTTRTALMDFHEAMHPMHMALGEKDFGLLRQSLPKLVEASKGVKAYKCDGYDKCSKECRSNFDGSKKALLKSVKELRKACKGKNDQKVEEKFNVMHEAYITFANTCVQEEKPEGHTESTQ